MLPFMLCIANALEAQLREAMQRAFPEVDALLDPQLAPASKPEFGDFQAMEPCPWPNLSSRLLAKLPGR